MGGITALAIVQLVRCRRRHTQRSDQCLIGEAMLPSSEAEAEAEAAEALWQGTGAGGGDANIIGEC